jgi:hypothetical protein
VSGFPAAQLWFREESELRPNLNLVHAFIEGNSRALCDETSIVYHKSETFQIPPEGGVIHEACQKAVAERNKT